MGKKTLFGASMLAVSMMMTVSAQAGKPGEFNGNCIGYGSANPFRDLCETNVELGFEGYIGSCDGGGRCDDSVDNKLNSPLDKHMKGKVDDAMASVCSIGDNAITWAGARKAKLTEDGLTDLLADVESLAVVVSGGTCY